MFPKGFFYVKEYLQDPGGGVNVKVRLPVAFCLYQSINTEAVGHLKEVILPVLSCEEI